MNRTLGYLMLSLVGLWIAPCAVEAQVIKSRAGEVKSTADAQLKKGETLEVQSIEVAPAGAVRGHVSFIGTNGHKRVLPDGKYTSADGTSIIVVTGMVKQIVRPGAAGMARPLQVSSMEVASSTGGGPAPVFFIGTNGRKFQLSDGTYTSEAGASIVVQNRTITRLVQN